MAFYVKTVEELLGTKEPGFQLCVKKEDRGVEYFIVPGWFEETFPELGQVFETAEKAKEFAEEIGYEVMEE